MQQQILAKLAEVDVLLATATCDGELLNEQVAEDVYSALSTLTQQIQYYID